MSFYSGSLYREAAAGKVSAAAYMLFLAIVISLMTLWQVLELYQMMYDDFTDNAAAKMPVMQFAQDSTLHINYEQPYRVSPLPRIAPNVKIIFDAGGTIKPQTVEDYIILFTDKAFYFREGDKVSSYSYADMELGGLTITPQDMVTFLESYILLLKISSLFVMLVVNLVMILVAAAAVAIVMAVINFVILPAKYSAIIVPSRLIALALLVITPALIVEIPAEHYGRFDFPKTPFYAGYVIFALHNLCRRGNMQ